MAGPKHGLPRGVAVYSAGRPDAEELEGQLSRSARLTAWCRAHGLELTGSPDDLGPLDQAIDHAAAEPGSVPPAAAVSADVGLFLGTVIAAGVPGARWKLWPNGHPVIRLADGRDLDVLAHACDRISKGSPPLADVYADAAGTRQ